MPSTGAGGPKCERRGFHSYFFSLYTLFRRRFLTQSQSGARVGRAPAAPVGPLFVQLALRQYSS